MNVAADRFPTIAIVIPVHNMASYLPRAVFSALWQLRPGDELIVVDDGSSDMGDYAGLKGFLDRLIWLRNPECRGLPFSRNRAIRHTSADWIKPLDADDVLAPFALELLRRAVPPLPDDIHVFAGGCHRIIDGRYHDYLSDSEGSLSWILQHNPLLPSATFIRRSALLEVGLFDDRLDFEEDWDMWLRLHERYGPGCFATTTAPVCYYWIHGVERSQKRRHATVEGIPVREYFRRRYHADPQP